MKEQVSLKIPRETRDKLIRMSVRTRRPQGVVLERAIELLDRIEKQGCERIFVCSPEGETVALELMW